MADSTVDAVLELLGEPDRLDEHVTSLAELDKCGLRKDSAGCSPRWSGSGETITAQMGTSWSLPDRLLSSWPSVTSRSAPVKVDLHLQRDQPRLGRRRRSAFGEHRLVPRPSGQLEPMRSSRASDQSSSRSTTASFSASWVARRVFEGGCKTSQRQKTAPYPRPSLTRRGAPACQAMRPLWGPARCSLDAQPSSTPLLALPRRSRMAGSLGRTALDQLGIVG